MVSRTLTMVLFAAIAFGQGKPTQSSPAPSPAVKPPLEVELALRARVNEFYDMQTKRQYRQSEALIAEDSKDGYYESQKIHCLGYEISDITFVDNAVASVVVK